MTRSWQEAWDTQEADRASWRNGIRWKLFTKEELQDRYLRRHEIEQAIRYIEVVKNKGTMKADAFLAYTESLMDLPAHHFAKAARIIGDDHTIGFPIDHDFRKVIWRLMREAGEPIEEGVGPR